MPAITSLGIGSGLDINSMVTQLVAVESRPLTLMQRAATSLQTQISSYGTLTSLFGALQTAANKLAGNSLWSQSKASSSDAAAVSVVGGSGAAAGNYTVSVQRLAGSQTVASGAAFGSGTELVGAGSLRIELGAWEDAPPLTFVPKVGGGAVVVDVSATDTLQTLRDKINAADAGVTASIVTDSNGARLSMRSSSSGAENGFRVQATDTGDGNDTDAAGLSRFAFDPATLPAFDPDNPTPVMVLKQSAQDALATVNGIDIVSSSNELGSAVEGLTLRLHKVTTSNVDISADADRESVKTAVQAFATAYNDLAKAITEQTKYDPTSKVAGALQGDSAVSGLLRQLRGVINTPTGASSTFSRLSDIGLELQRDGTLSVNATKLDAASLKLPELKAAFANNDDLDNTNDGFARRYADLATQVLGADGSLTSRTQGLRDQLARNATDQDKLSDRIERYQARLVAQYTTMDANLSKLNALSSYLTQQLATLSKSVSNDN